MKYVMEKLSIARDYLNIGDGELAEWTMLDILNAILELNQRVKELEDD